MIRTPKKKNLKNSGIIQTVLHPFCKRMSADESKKGGSHVLVMMMGAKEISAVSAKESSIKPRCHHPILCHPIGKEAPKSEHPCWDCVGRRRYLGWEKGGGLYIPTDADASCIHLWVQDSFLFARFIACQIHCIPYPFILPMLETISSPVPHSQ